MDPLDYMKNARPVEPDDTKDTQPVEPDYMKNARPVGPDPAVIAHAAADDAQKAGQAIDVSQKTGLALGYIAGGLDESIKALDKQKFTTQLQGRPAMSAWAAQSPQHAALLRPDAEAAGKMEGWFSGWGDALWMGVHDIFYAEAMREHMNGDNSRLANNAMWLEDVIGKYDQQKHGYPQTILRAVPQMAMYGLAHVSTGPAGVAGLLYAQNKGVLARQIQLAQPAPEADSRPWQWKQSDDGHMELVEPEPVQSDTRLTPDEINKYATYGSAIGAVTLAGLLSPILRSIPGVRGAVEGLVPEVLARGASNTLLQAGIRSLLSYGQHTFMGTMGMVLQHSINSETVKKAAGRDTDLGQIAREAADTFAKVWPIAATFATYGNARDFMAERGRLNLAPVERARLDAQVELAKQMQLTKSFPDRAAELFGLMGRGAKVFIDWAAAKKMKGIPPADVAAAEAAQDDVEVPLSEYLARMADEHESVKDDVKLSPYPAMTMNQARARNKELRGALPEDIAQVLLGEQSPDDILGFEQPEPEKTEVPPPAPKAAEGKVAETVKLFRGTVGRDPNLPGRAGARFLSPDRKVAEGYASPENSMNAGAAGEGKVAEETLHFENVLKADSLDAVKAKLGFEEGKPVGSEEVLNTARAKGYDAVTYMTKELGPVYVDLMNWLHELVKQYGGTVEDWQKKAGAPEFVAALKEEGGKGAVAPEEHAARLIEAMPVGEIDPARFEKLAKKSDKYIQNAAEAARTGSVAGAQKYSPSDVAVLQTHELARDVNRAKAAKAAAVQTEMQKSFENLSKQAVNQKLRALLNLAGAPLLHLFDALTEGSGASKTKQGWVAAHNEAVSAGAEPFSPEANEHADAQMRDALPGVAQWLKDSARPKLPDERFVEKFLANPRPWDQLLPAEARTLADTVHVLTKAAREENTVRRKDAEATVAEKAEEINAELRQNPDKGLPLPSGVPSTWWRDRLLDANAANAVQLRPKNNLRQKSTTAWKWIEDPIHEAMYTRDGYFREVGKPLKAAFDAMPKEIAKRRNETYDLSDKLPVQGMEPLTNVPRRWLWQMAKHRMSKGNMEVVASTSGWDRHVIDNILFDDPKTKLTVPEWDYLQSLADIKEGVWSGKVKPHYEKYYGLAPPKTAGVPFKVKLEDGTWKEYKGGYEPLKRDARPGVAPQPEPTKGIAQYWNKDFQVPWTPGSMKERVDNAHYLVNMDWDSSLNSMGKVLHWLAFDQPVRSVAKLLNDPSVAATMNQYMGEGRTGSVRGWLKAAATGQAQSVPEGMEIVGKVFGWQRRAALMGIVGGSARLAVAQAGHPAGLMLGGEVNPIHGLPALLSIFKPMTMADGEVRLFPNWNDAIIHGKEVQHRADNAFSTLRRTWDKTAPSSGPLGALKELALKTAGLYLHAVDRLTTTWAWTAFHNEAVAKYKMEPFSEEAKDYANGKTFDVMPAHDIETAAPILTNRQMGGFLIMHGFKSTLYNMRQDALAKSVKDFNLAETPGDYGSAIAKAAGRVALQTAMFGGFAVMGKMALGYGQQEEESKGQWIARDFLGGQFADIPLIGGLAEPIAKWMTGGHLTKWDFSAYGNPGVAAIVKVQDMLGNLVNGGREDYKKVFDVLEALLFLGGVPSHMPRVGAEHIYELLAGEGFDITDRSDTGGRLFYTEKQWDSIKRSLTPDE